MLCLLCKRGIGRRPLLRVQASDLLRAMATHSPFCHQCHHRDHETMLLAALAREAPCLKMSVEGTEAQWQSTSKFHVFPQSPSKSASSHSGGLLGVVHNGQDPGNPGGGGRAMAEALIEWSFLAAPLPLIVSWWNKHATVSRHWVTHNTWIDTSYNPGKPPLRPDNKAKNTTGPRSEFEIPTQRQDHVCAFPEHPEDCLDHLTFSSPDRLSPLQR